MKAQVQIRRTLNFEVKPEAEELDGKIFEFERGWEIESTDSRYPGEIAWLFVEHNASNIGWIASGDLKIIEQ